MDSLFWICCPMVSHMPPSITGYCQGSWLPSRTLQQDPIAEYTTYISHRTRGSQVGTHLETSSLLARFHSAGTCYSCWNTLFMLPEGKKPSSFCPAVTLKTTVMASQTRRAYCWDGSNQPLFDWIWGSFHKLKLTYGTMIGLILW